MPDEKHAKYSPSQLPRIIRCPGSVKASEHYTNDSSVFAEEGTMLHEVMERCLKSQQFSVPGAIIKEFNLTDEHIEACDICLEEVFKLLVKHDKKPEMIIESKVSLGYLATTFSCDYLNDVYGTADLILKFDDLTYVIDWKFGKGIEVFPDSEQLYAYALGALIDCESDKATIIVAQPRLYNGELFKYLDVTRQELLTWLEKSLVPALELIDSEEACITPSEKGCRWCLAKNQCEGRYKKALQTARDLFSMHAESPNQVPIEKLAKLVEDSRELKKYIADLEVFLVSTLRKGNQVPGYKLVAGRSLRVWADVDKSGKPQKMLDWLEAETGLTEFDVSTIKLMGPAGVEKKIKKLKHDPEFKAMITKPPGKPTMVPESDKRKALVMDTAADAFKEFVK